MGKELDQSFWHKVKSPFGIDEYVPKLIDINPRQLQFYKKRAKRIKYLLLILLVLCLLILILLIILIPLLIIKRDLPTRTTTTTERITTTERTTTTTERATTTTTTRRMLMNCSYPNVITLNGNCVNILIDSLNCGSIGNICELNMTCSAGQCANVPGVQLNESISIWSSAINGSADDQMFTVKLPWKISLYNITTDEIIVTTDGVICFSNCSTTYTESELPSNIFVNVTLYPFWDDLYIYENTSQGIYYQSYGEYPFRQLIIEYYMSHFVQENQFYHFQIKFFENHPGIVEYFYFDATDGGDTSTIGIQRSNIGPYILYSYDQQDAVQQNLRLIFNTNLGIFNKTILN